MKFIVEASAESQLPPEMVVNLLKQLELNINNPQNPVRIIFHTSTIKDISNIDGQEITEC